MYRGSQKNCTISWMHAVCHKAQRYYLREINDSDIVLFKIYWSTCVPEIIKIKLSLTKLLQKIFWQ